MCEWCEENGGEPISCQDCGKLLCWDIEGEGDDIMGRPYVTAAGDVFCVSCGQSVDRAEEEDEYSDLDDYGDEEFDDYDEDYA